MADNVNYTNPGTGTVIGVDSCTVNAVANVGVPLGKIGFGANDSFTYVTSTVGLPGNLAQVGGSSFALGQQLAASSLPVVLTAAQLATLTPLSTVAVTGTFWQATQPVSGTFWQTTQGVAGNVASLTTDSGNPVKVGAVYNTASPAPLNGQRVDLQSDSAGNLKVNVVSGSTGNAAAGNTGSSVPAQASYDGLNVAGNLRGNTGSNPSGSIYAAHCDLVSMGGSTLTIGQQLSSASIPVVLPAAQITTLTPPSSVGITGSVAVTGTFWQTTQGVAGNVASLATDSGNPVKVGAVYNSSAPTATTGQRVDLQADASGNLKVNVVSGSTGNAAASNTGSAVPTQASYDGINVAGNLRGNTGSNPSGSIYAAHCDIASISGTTLALGQAVAASCIPVVLPSATNVPVTGTFWQTTQPVSGTVTANAGTNLNTSLLALETGGNLATIAGAITSSKAQINQAQINGVTPLMGNGVTGTGSQRVTIASDNTAFSVNAVQSGTWNVGTVTTVTTVSAVTAITNALPAGTNSIGGVTLTGSTTGGASSYHLVAANTTNATSVKASAGTLKGIQAFNSGSVVAYLKLYNKASAPTVGTDTVVKTIAIPASSTGAGVVVPLPPEGLAFGTGIAFAITGLVADTDTTAVAASSINIELDYK
jgi:hypothetical protein